MTWDPEKLECRSYFGYGSGYFMAEDHARAKAAGFPQTPEYRQFCSRCPISQACWQDHQARVRREDPDASAKWDALVAKNEADGIDAGRIAASLLAAGRPDPWMKSLLANLKLGQESRSAT